MIFIARGLWAIASQVWEAEARAGQAGPGQVSDGQAYGQAEEVKIDDFWSKSHRFGVLEKYWVATQYFWGFGG